MDYPRPIVALIDDAWRAERLPDDDIEHRRDGNAAIVDEEDGDDQVVVASEEIEKWDELALGDFTNTLGNSDNSANTNATSAPT